MQSSIQHKLIGLCRSLDYNSFGLLVEVADQLLGAVGIGQLDPCGAIVIKNDAFQNFIELHDALIDDFGVDVVDDEDVQSVVHFAVELH